MKNKKMLVLMGSIFTFGLVQGQTSTNASGGDATGNGSVSYSIGQVFYTSNGNGSVNQGVQQAYEIFVLGVDDYLLDISLSVYPNPTSDELVLRMEDTQIINNLQYCLYDLQGKKLKSDKIISNNTMIDLSGLPSTTYIINIEQNNQKIKSFKIIKK